MIKIGITGHRNLKEECISYYEYKVKEILKSLQEIDGDILIYSALADGADRLIVKVGKELDIGYKAVLPMKKSEYMIDFDQKSQVEFNHLIDDAISISVMSIVKNFKNRSLQYEASGHYIADHCNILIALWDGKYINLKGGTSEIIAYYLAKKKHSLYHLQVSRNNDLTNDMIEFKIFEK